MTDQKPPLVRMKRTSLTNLVQLIRQSYRTALLKACSRSVMDMEEAASIEDEALVLIEAGIKTLPKD